MRKRGYYNWIFEWAGGFQADAFGETDKRMETESVSLRLSALSPFEAGCGLTIASIAPIQI